MEVSLYNSTVCRLCGEENDSGTLLYSVEENNQSLSELINTYLPIKVSDDGQLPRTICPGCTIQLEATVEFLNLIINGQKVIRELHQREKEYKKNLLGEEIEVITEKIVYSINTSDGVYHVEHPIALQVSGLDKPKRKRGRPPKKTKSPEEEAEETAAKESEIEAKKQSTNDGEVTGKRRRKTPTRFKEAVQGKELERIFKEEGVIDGDESEAEVKPEIDVEAPKPPKEPEVIGHLEKSGELVVVVKGKGRGRPKGRMRQTREECAICGMEFSCVGRYMSHVAQHGPVIYQCECGHSSTTRLEHQKHQKDSGHTKHVVVPQTPASIVPPTQASANDGVVAKNPEKPEGPLDCGICEIEFPYKEIYTAHMEKHGPLLYHCECGHTTTSTEDQQKHRKESGHSKQVIVPYTPDENKKILPKKPKVEMKSLPKLIPDTPPKEEPDSASEFIDVEDKPELPIEPSPVVETENSEQVDPDPVDPLKCEDAKKPGEKKVKERLKCPQCDKSFNSKQSRSLHIKAVHNGEKPYTCTECGWSFAYPRSLALHQLSHRRRNQAARRYACDLCGKVLNHPSSVVYHKEAEHAGQRYVCNTCGKCFKHKQLLQRHQLVHSQLRPYNCKTCNASFKTKANLINHQLLHSGVKKFSCEICKHKFAHKTSLTLHMRWHTGSKPYSCSVCSKSFSQKGNLSEHLRIHTGEKPYACALCPRRFTTSSQYRLHAKRHQPERPYACNHCPKRFVSRSSWQAHVRRTLGLRLHSCSSCGRAFSERWALLKHQRRHTGERPFRCNHCPRAFADCSNLNKHKKQVHKQISLLVNNEKNQQQTVEQQPQQIQQISPQHISQQQITQQQIQQIPQQQIQQISQQQIQQISQQQIQQISRPQMQQISQQQIQQISQQQIQQISQQQMQQIQEEDTLTVTEVVSDMDNLEERVIYVTYDMEDNDTSYHIIDPEEAAALQQSDAAVVQGVVPLVTEPQMAVTDEQGNPLHFTMSDGTRLAITSSDGRSLQVVTHDGRAIPVEINHFTEPEEVEEDSMPSDAVVHQLDFQKTADEETSVTHYFTIV